MKSKLERLGDNIRSKRKLLGITQEELAHKCDFDRTYISLLERGKRNIAFENLAKLAEGLESSVSELAQGL